jgi:hypothetical protein
VHQNRSVQLFENLCGCANLVQIAGANRGQTLDFAAKTLKGKRHRP